MWWFSNKNRWFYACCKSQWSNFGLLDETILDYVSIITFPGARFPAWLRIQVVSQQLWMSRKGGGNRTNESWSSQGSSFTIFCQISMLTRPIAISCVLQAISNQLTDRPMDWRMYRPTDAGWPKIFLFFFNYSESNNASSFCFLRSMSVPAAASMLVTSLPTIGRLYNSVNGDLSLLSPLPGGETTCSVHEVERRSLKRFKKWGGFGLGKREYFWHRDAEVRQQMFSRTTHISGKSCYQCEIWPNCSWVAMIYENRAFWLVGVAQW